MKDIIKSLSLIEYKNSSEIVKIAKGKFELKEKKHNIFKRWITLIKK